MTKNPSPNFFNEFKFFACKLMEVIMTRGDIEDEKINLTHKNLNWNR